MYKSFDPEIEQKIQELIALAGGKDSSSADLIEQIIQSSLKLLNDNLDRGQLKLMTKAFKEMRYAYHIFNRYLFGRCVSIFGSARTKESDPNYLTAKEFSLAMAAHNWFCMTGAADGIMKAGLEGAPKTSRFGLSIKLPFENAIQALLADDPKLISFRYFFTRKLMFLSHSHALAAFPGGVGTQDELFEALTLMQTGRSNIVPIVLIEANSSNYWKAWEHYLQNNLLADGYISPEDQYLYYRAPSVQHAVDHILLFYKRYHSSRYVNDLLVIRLLYRLLPNQIEILNREFSNLISEGNIFETTAFPEEIDHLELPRIAFKHNHRNFGLLRSMINRINLF